MTNRGDFSSGLAQISSAAFFILAAILVVGLTLRVCLAIAFPDIYHADEIFQTLEPAHRLVTGWGIVTWEWRNGIRSWLLPGILAGLMKLAGGRDADPHSYLVLITIVFSLTSLSIVAVAAAAGQRIAGITGLAIAGAASAGWYDLVYFGPKTLSDTAAANTLIIAVYLATIIATNNMSITRRRWLVMLLGFLLGLTFWLRFHLALALPLIAAWACRGKVKDLWVRLISGAMILLIAFGVTDWLTLGTPFQSVWKNVWINVVEGRSNTFGTDPVNWYVSELARSWRWAFVPILALAYAGARRLPLFALVSAIIIGSMSIVPHKEVRFIFPALALIIVLAGVGTALIIERSLIIERLRLLLWPAGRGWLPSSLAILAWLLTSAIIAIRGSWPGFHSEHYGFSPSPYLIQAEEHYGFSPSPYVIQAETYLHQRRDMCGLGLLGVHWTWTRGYTGLHRPVPITEFVTSADFTDHASSVNWLLANADLISTTEMKALLERDDIPKFVIARCWPTVCVMHREGACAPMFGWDINTQMSDKNW
jgi:hypothetical protein